MEICLDVVEGLGTFIEVEAFADGKTEEVQERLFAFLRTLGIKDEDRVTKGYDTLVREKNEAQRAR